MIPAADLKRMRQLEQSLGILQMGWYEMQAYQELQLLLVKYARELIDIYTWKIPIKIEKENKGITND